MVIGLKGVRVGDLSVIVRLHGAVVENRVLAVSRAVRLGESPSADVPFPGADLTVRRHGDRLAIRGRTLGEGDDLTIRLGKVEVQLEHTLRSPVPHEWAGQFDGRFLMVLVLVAVSATWLDAFDWWAAAHFPQTREHGVVEQLAQRLWTGTIGPTGDPRQAAAVPHPDPRTLPEVVVGPSADGPVHRSDDHSSGTGWYSWYRSAVPRDVEQLDAAVALHLQDPFDADARSLLGQAAYGADRFDEAARQYAFIVKHHPDDPSARMRLAQAEMRRGNHSREIAHYERILRSRPHDVAARAALAVALTRLERLDEAAGPLEELRLEHTDAPLTALAEAKVAALAGRDTDALDHLDEVMYARTTLSEAWQLEVRRDIALDPAFARLRNDVRLRSVINRHLGAAGPRPVR